LHLQRRLAITLTLLSQELILKEIAEMGAATKQYPQYSMRSALNYWERTSGFRGTETHKVVQANLDKLDQTILEIAEAHRTYDYRKDPRAKRYPRY
jgi:hypothetical protein